MGATARWQDLRYRTLLPLTGRSRAAATAYARLCGAIELARDPRRCEVASVRIARWLQIDAGRARAVFRDSLISEAREEADSLWMMRQPSLPAIVPAGDDPPEERGPVVWATLHFGSPVLAYLYLRRVRGLDVQIVGRPLDDANPMPAAKRDWGRRKVAWLERRGGMPLLGVDATATSLARTRLMRGGSICVLMDVPGDVVARRMALDLCGERVSLAAGIFLLAGMVGVPVVPLVAVHRGGRFTVHHGARIEPGPGRVPKEDVAREIARFLRAMPGEWWLWPYVPGVGDA